MGFDLEPKSTQKVKGIKEEWSPYDPLETLCPERLESVHPRFVISWRNKWMVQEANVVVTYTPTSGVERHSSQSWQKGRKSESSTSHR